MNLNNFIVKSAIPFCCLIFVACAADDDVVGNIAENQSSETVMTFSASMDSEDNLTRVSFDSNYTIWSKYDKIYI